MDDNRTLYEGAEPYLFISYSHRDSGRVFPVLQALCDRGYRVWFDEGIYAGDPWTKTLAERISHCAVFVPFLSPAYMESDNCLQEVRMVDKSQIIVPVWLEKLDRSDVPPEMKFLLNKSQELRLDKYADENAFADHLAVEKHFRPCRAVPAAAAAHRPAEPVTAPPPAPSAYFVGRAEKLDAIETAFRDGAAVVNLYGMAGIGKSEICRKLFQSCTAAGTDLFRQVGWVTWQGTLRETFYAQFPEIQEQNTERYWQLAQQFMRSAGRELLMILDNADTMPNAVADQLSGLGCRFLVTSRGPLERVRIIPAGTLPMEQCRVLYRRALARDDAVSNDAPDPTLDELLRLAACHTLTVELLAKTQRAAGFDTAELLDKLRRTGFDLTGVEEEILCTHHLAPGEEDAAYQRFIEHMARIFDLSSLREGSPIPWWRRLLRWLARIFGKSAAVDRSGPLYALQGMSLLAPNVMIPKQQVKEWLDLPNLNGLNRAADAGWLNQRTEDGMVSIHPVVAAVVQHTEPPDADMVNAVAGRLCLAMIPGETEVFVTRLPIVEHAVALDRFAQSMGLRTVYYGGMLGQMGYLMMKQADYDNSLSYQKRGAEIKEATLGSDHLVMAVAYDNIGQVYLYQGDSTNALEWFQKALRIEEKVLGTDHPKTAITYDNIGLVYSDMGDYDAALGWHQKSLRIKEAALGPNHPETAASYHNIAGIYYEQGDYTNALDWYQKALWIVEKVLGAGHPNTAITYNNIGIVYYHQGDYEEAMKWFRKAQATKMKVLGPNHPSTKNTEKWIAATEEALTHTQ